MLQTNPQKRPSTDEFLNHEIIIRKTNSKASSNKIETEHKSNPFSGTTKTCSRNATKRFQPASCGFCHMLYLKKLDAED